MAYNHEDAANKIEKQIKDTDKDHIARGRIIDALGLPGDISDTGLIYHTSKIHKILKGRGLMIKYDANNKEYRVKPEEKPQTDAKTTELQKPEEAQTEIKQEADPTEELMPKWTEVIEIVEKNPSKIYELNSILQEFGLKAVLKVQVEQL
jgi:hydroxymethylpyrimidine pyrophosphatase-like HAD family hydrolase